MTKETDLTPWPKEMPRGINIQPVFEVGGVTYYQVRDVFNTFAGRGMKQLEVYEEWQSRLTRERILAFVMAMEGELNKDRIQLTNIADLINKMKERLMFPVPTSEIIIKMAAVAYFDESESAEEPDEMYAREVKIPHWRAHGVTDFFIGQRLSDLVPWPTISEDVFKQVSRVIQEMVESENRTLERVSQPE
jgi:hypothetical protein